MRRGVIAIPTRGRPRGLEKALNSIERLQTTAQLTVLVADNDACAQEGISVVSRISSAGYRFPIRSMIVTPRGVAHVRNELIASALEDPKTEFIALLDDDEWPETQWLETLLSMQRRTGADAVGGTMLPDFSITPPSWAEDLKLYRQQATDGPIDMLWGTCNVLLTRKCVETLPPPWFDEQFGLSGGEDVEFFSRLNAKGAAFAWASEARVFEEVPRDRLTIGWIARRSFRIGNTNARSQLRWRYRRLGYPAIITKSIGRLCAAAALIFLRANQRSGPVEAMCLSCRSLGELAALFGIRYLEYK